jgi:Kef-type K+ transport system membrane component KefB
VLPAIAGGHYGHAAHVITFLTMIALAFIMIHVGYEFDIDKSNLRQYGWDYVIAATAAAFPWIFCAAYFVVVLGPPDAVSSWLAWKQSLLTGRFAAPTSAGVLFSMLTAAGLGATWVFRKIRVLAIFDDLDTVLLLIPLKMMMVGLAWQLGVVVLTLAVLLWLAWRYLHQLRISIRWPTVLTCSAVIVAISEAIYYSSRLIDEVVPIHIEVLLPAFVLGCMIAGPSHAGTNAGESDPHHIRCCRSPVKPAWRRSSPARSWRWSGSRCRRWQP